MKDCKIIDKCLLCHGETKKVLSLGNTPLANEFVNSPDTKQDLFPLNLIQCVGCNHIQLDCIINKERLYQHYHYVSSTSSANVKHFQDYADKLIDKFNLTSQDTVVEIASNDGCFLRNFKEKHINIIGIDPAQNIAKQANNNGIFTIAEFFSQDLAKSLSEKYGKVKVIVANNVFAHNDDLDTIVNGVNELLADDGVFVFENSYLLDILNNNLLDLIYHEHIHHHHLLPLIQYFNRFGLEIFDVERLPNHGGSIRVYVCKKMKRIINLSILEAVKSERKINDKVDAFKNKIETLKTKLNNQLNELKNQGKSIAIYGMPAKATTLLYALGIDETIIDFAVDDAILKQGTFSPGKHIPIFSPDEIYQRNPDVLLVLAWNFADSIIEKHSNFNGKWIIPLPEYKELN